MPMLSMKRSQRRRLFNLFAFAVLAFAIYLTVFKKDEPVTNMQNMHTGVSQHTR